VILPRRNEANLLEDVPAEVREALTVHLVDAVDEAVELALEPAIEPQPVIA
jgi:ATP-dependent Lon protease